MKKIVALGASNSKKSINKVLATYVANQVNDSMVEVLDLNDFELPLYGIDFELENGIPENAQKMLDLIHSADGLVISFAEHNGAYSTAFKNAFDWMSRINGKLWNNIPMLLLSTSPGERGGATVLDIAKNRFPYMGGNVIDALAFPSFNENFKENDIVNSDLKETVLSSVNKLQEAI